MLILLIRVTLLERDTASAHIMLSKFAIGNRLNK